MPTKSILQYNQENVKYIFLFFHTDLELDPRLYRFRTRLYDQNCLERRWKTQSRVHPPSALHLPAYCFAALIHFAIWKNLLPNCQKISEKHLLSDGTGKWRKSDSDSYLPESEFRNMVLHHIRSGL